MEGFFQLAAFRMYEMSSDLDAADVEAALVLWDLYRLVSMPASPRVSLFFRLMVLMLTDRKGVWRPMKSCEDERSFSGSFHVLF